MTDLKAVPKMSRGEAVQLRAMGRMFLAQAADEPDKMLALETKQVGNEAIAKAEEAINAIARYDGGNG